MILSTIFNSIIIILFLYVARLSYSYYSTSKKNHYKYKTLYSAGFLMCFQAVLAFNFIWFGDSILQETRWFIFYIVEVLYMSMLLKNTKLQRRHELSITSLFLVVVLMGTVQWSLAFDMVKVVILIFLGLTSKEPITRKYYTISMCIYGLALLAPSLFGLTGNESLFMGVLFASSFAYASKKIYNKEKIDDALLELIREENYRKEIERIKK